MPLLGCPVVLAVGQGPHELAVDDVLDGPWPCSRDPPASDCDETRTSQALNPAWNHAPTKGDLPSTSTYLLLSRRGGRICS